MENRTVPLDPAPAPAKPRGPGGSIAALLLVALAVIALLAAGVIVFGRSAADETVAMALTAAWFAVVAGGAFLVGRSRPQLRLPMGVGFGLTAIVVTVVLGLPMFTDETVNERVVTATPQEPGSSSPNKDRGSKPAGNVELASGSFGPLAHPGSGDAAVIELPNGDRRLTLTDFETDNGPDLFVYLTSGQGNEGAVGDFVNLGGLKGNKGDQQYVIPDDVNLRRHSTVLIWCRSFTVGFTEAPLERSN